MQYPPTHPIPAKQPTNLTTCLPAYQHVKLQANGNSFPGAQNAQDDLAIIANNVGYRADDYGSSQSDASPIHGVGTSGTSTLSGIIETRSDVDTFTFTTGGAFSLDVTVVTYDAVRNTHGGNLDTSLDVLDSSYNVICNSNPNGNPDSACSRASLPAGTYYLRVSGVGDTTKLSNGDDVYTDYGSEGQYDISVTTVVESACTENIDCSNNIFCDGIEICTEAGDCVDGTAVACSTNRACESAMCTEGVDAAVCSTDSTGCCDVAGCDSSIAFCDGGSQTCNADGNCDSGNAVVCDQAGLRDCEIRTCVNGYSAASCEVDTSACCETTGCDDGSVCTTDTCETNGSCSNSVDPDCVVCNDGTCGIGETCNSCAGDCVSGTFGGARCGDNVCNADRGEDCSNCPEDCNGITGGKKRNRYCCGDNTPCSDSRCSYGSGTQTNTKAGLELVESTMLKESNGMRPRSSNVPRVVVVITDGISTPSSQNPTSVATRLRSRGVTILSVGVQGYSTSQLVAMSSFPPAKYTRGSDDFSGLAKVLKSVAETIHDVISQPIVTSKFDRPVDLMILVDESGGITSGCSPSGSDRCWGDVVNFVVGVVDAFKIGAGNAESRVGLVSFGSSAKVQFVLNAQTTNEAVTKAIRAIQYGTRVSSSNTKDGLNAVKDSLFTEEGGMRAAALNIPRIVLVVSTSQSAPGQNAKDAADELKKQGASIFSIGVKKYAPMELDEMASPPPDDFVRKINDFPGMEHAVEDVVQLISTTAANMHATGVKAIDASTNESVGPDDRCDEAVDLVFLLDDSGSAVADGNNANWVHQLDFVTKVIDSFTIGSRDDTARVGLATFSASATTHIKLGELTKNSDVEAKVKTIPNSKGGQTRTKSGLQNVANLIMQAESATIGPRAKSKGIARVVVVVTDGATNPAYENPGSVAEMLKESGVSIISVGIKGFVRVELDAMASSPIAKHVHTVQAFSDLAKIAKSVTDTIRDAVQTSREKLVATDWCQPESRKVGCSEIPPTDSFANTNTDYLDTYGKTIAVPAPTTKHVCDGAFTDSSAGGDLVEWKGITPAIGRFTNAYFSYDGEKLHILNDWIYNTDKDVKANCYNLFNAFTGDGKERWIIKVYGDKHVEVNLNGAPLKDSDGSCGAVNMNISPKFQQKSHTIFELSFKASPGRFGVQIHNAGPRFGCDVLETEPTTFIGHNNPEGGLQVSSSDTSSFANFNSVWCNAGNGFKPPCKKMPTPFNAVTSNQRYLAMHGITVYNPKPKTNHVTDGKFTGFSKGDAVAGYYPFGASTESDHNEREWSNTQPAIGRYTNAYFEYDGSHLHILNDWKYNDNSPVRSNCYNLFNGKYKIRHPNHLKFFFSPTYLVVHSFYLNL